MYTSKMQGISRCYDPDIRKSEFSPKYTKLEKGHFIMPKATIHSENITRIYMYQIT